MGRARSLVVKTGVDFALKAHNCQANSRHRIERGDVRLKVRNGRSWDHYCRACAMNMIARDLQRLAGLQELTPSVEQEDLEGESAN
jgi:hypothetical protein